MAKKIYKKLGKKRSSIISSSLWQSDSHLLYCEYVGFEESYRRFYYKDIQGIIISKSIRSKMITLALFVLVVFYYLLWQFQWQHISLIILAVIHSLAVLVNIYKGDSCTTHIQTSVQQTNLRPLNRVKKVDRVLKSISPFIQASQGDFPPELLEKKYASIAAAKASKTGGQPQPAVFQKSPFHLAAFGMLIGMGVMELIDYYVNHVGITLTSSIFSMGLTVVIIMALVQHARLRIRPALKTLTWITAGYMCVLFALSYALLMVTYVKAMEAGDTEIFRDQSSWTYLKLLSESSPEDSILTKIIALTSLYGSLVLGSLGVLTYSGGKTSDAK